MNRRLHLFHTIGLLAAAAMSFTLALAALGPGVAGQLGQSPLSPVTDVPRPPAPDPVSRWSWVWSESTWTSPLPWAAVGLILFSALAWALIRRLRSSRSADDRHEKPPLPPGWAP